LPSVQAAVRDRLQRFGLVLVNPTPTIASSTVAPNAAAPVMSSPQRITRISVADAQQKVPFPIRTPTWLPGRLVPRGAIVAPGSTTGNAIGVLVVDIAYGPADGSSGGLHIQQAPNSAAAAYTFPADRAQEANINGYPAVYVKGAWQDAGQWNDAADSGVLSWEMDGFTYLVQFSGLGLTQADLIHIAESLR